MASCKQGVFLVNCARGGIIDEAALLRNLESGQVAGAALDVFEEEPPTGSQLLAHDRVICTPHLGASTVEAQESVALQVAGQVGDVLMGRVIRNAINAPSVEPEIYAKMRPYLELAERLGKLQAQLSEGRLRARNGRVPRRRNAADVSHDFCRFTGDHVKRYGSARQRG